MGRGRFSKVVSVLVTGIIAMSGLPSAVLADVINAPTYYSVQSGLEYEITTNVTSSWIYHTSVDFVVSNTGDETIHNWYITFNTPYTIDNIWNGALYETNGNGTYTITSNGWNQDIHPGETVTVGATFSSTENEALTISPEWYLLNTQATVVDESLYTLDYIEYSSWESGFTGQLTLQPQVDCQHWELSFASNREITAVSSAVLIYEGDNNYAITHDENNMRLFANNAYNFGIQGVNSEASLEFYDVDLTVVDLAYHLTDDVDGNGISDYLDFMGGGIVVEPTPTPTDAPTVSPTEQPTEIPTEDPTDTPTPTEEPTPTDEVDPEFYMRDRDNDGLLDYQEEMYMTNPDNPDTDGDGLLDGDEINILTNPRVVDTDGNGISDFEEDFDGDGIHNGGEYATGTCMFACDSDYDGVNDYNEVYFYGIDPRNEDSDSDGIKDGDEVALGLNPGSNDSNGDGITDDFVMFEQSLVMDPIVDDHPHEIISVTISGGISGLITSNTTIEDTYNRDVYCTDVYGRVGVPINIESEGHFDSMTLTISYDDSVLGETDENNLGVLWYDEETGFFVVQEQTVVDTTNNTVTLALNHFSTYILVDLNKWNNPTISSTTPTTGSIRTITWSTRGVYYGDPVIETNSQGQLVLVGWANQTASPERYENTAWDIYLESHPNDLRVETVNMRYIRDTWGGLTYVYTWKVYTTDSIDVDNDQDGVPDYWEIRGIYLLNGSNDAYTSEIGENNDTDSDNDNLTDIDEYNLIYIVSKSSDDGQISVLKISSGGQEVLDVNSSTYYLISSFADSRVNNGETVAFCDPYSNPDNPDTDEDNYRDGDDAIPMNENIDIVYIFSNPDFWDESLLRANEYTMSGYSVRVYEFVNADSFLFNWNGIGLYDDYYNYYGFKTYGDKYYYNAIYVVISTHGSASSLQLGKYLSSETPNTPEDQQAYHYDYLYTRRRSYDSQRSDSINNIVYTFNLESKRIASLNLYACSCGENNGISNNIAQDFLDEVEGVQQVIAADTTLYYYGVRFFFRGYHTPEVYPDEVYSQLYEAFCDPVNPISMYMYDSFTRFCNPSGFLIFKRDDSIVDYYSDDVVFGTLYTTEEGSNSGRNGILVYDGDFYNLLGNNSFDPILS